jgi:hypothetical protein
MALLYASTTRRKPRPTQLMKNVMVQPMFYDFILILSTCVSLYHDFWKLY